MEMFKQNHTFDFCFFFSPHIIEWLTSLQAEHSSLHWSLGALSGSTVSSSLNISLLPSKANTDSSVWSSVFAPVPALSPDLVPVSRSLALTAASRLWENPLAVRFMQIFPRQWFRWRKHIACYPNNDFFLPWKLMYSAANTAGFFFLPCSGWCSLWLSCYIWRSVLKWGLLKLARP